jgi:hypothetical protein
MGATTCCALGVAAAAVLVVATSAQQVAAGSAQQVAGSAQQVATSAQQAAAPAADILALLERDMAGKMTPWLAGRRGSFYMGGQSLAANNPLTSLWNVRENETLGFMHPYFRDGRTRGGAIVCDEITGCGHDLMNWDFYRDTRVLNGSVTVGSRVYSNPSPSSLLWRPDRLTAQYRLEPGVVLEEVKFFTNDDVFVDIIRLLPGGDASGAPAEVKMSFDGVSFVNTNTIPDPEKHPSSKGLPATTQRSIKRNATAEVDKSFTGCGGSFESDTRGTSSCSAIRVEEHGTGYAQPIDCKFAPLPPGVDCLLKEGPMMYEGMSVFIAASVDISSTATIGRDADRRASYAFSTQLSAAGSPLVLGWVMGDDADEARARIAAYMTPAAAAGALAARSEAANEFLTTKVPQLNVTLKPKAPDAPDEVFDVEEWDEHKGATCHNTNANKCNFLHNASDLAACEAACSADAECTQVEFQHTGKVWCALYNQSTVPSKEIAGSKFDCACKGPCPTAPSPTPGPPPPAPGPPPHPHKPPKPSPIPPMNRTLDFNDAYYFGWAMYWMMLLESNHPPYETVGHAQSAASNFLGIHLHDAQYYLRMGSWVEPELHPRYAHGNVLMWHQAAHSPMYSNASSSYWGRHKAKGLLPDNMGATWIASSTCPELPSSVADSLVIYERSGVHPPNMTFLAKAYDLFNTVLRPTDGNITSKNQKQSLRTGKGFNALLSLAKMATVLGKPDDAKGWLQLLDSQVPFFRKAWGTCGNRLGCGEGIVQFSNALAPAPYFDDEWAQIQADSYLLDPVSGYYPPNSSFGAVLLAKPLNTTATKIGPWVAHTTYTWEAIDGLFRHNAHNAAIKLATEHVRDMQRTFGWTIFPEAWSLLGGPWGDQWYNWGSCVSTVMTLERLAGVSYSSADRAPGASASGVLTVRDFLPDDWARVDVRVPLGGGKWAVVAVERTGEQSKRITVSGNPFGALKLQPALGSKRLTKAEPAGSTTESSGDVGRVDWLFVGAAARDATVTVEWA